MQENTNRSNSNRTSNTRPSGTPPSGSPGGDGSTSGQNNSGGQNNGGGSQSSSATHTGATELTTDTNLSDQTYTSSNSAENALLVKNATVTLNNPTITKSGDDSGDNSDFYGTNAAVFVYDNGTLNITGGTITTDGSHANAVFAYDSGTINISDTKITTSSNNSGGIMVTGGGTLNATNLTVETSGNSAAPIRSDRGGGTIVAEGGSFTSSGTGSPVIYSTADITVRNATLTATASEGVVIEGLNSVTLENTTVTDTNNQLNGNSETYKNIFIYQSMSGDAETGTGTFTAKNSTFTTNQGDHFFITNTTAVINLEANKFTNNDSTGAFLRAQSGKWGTSGSNGGKVTLNATSQEIIGDIVIDSISSLDLNLTNSYVKSTFTNEGTINLTLDSTSIVVLTGDSYITSLNNATTDNSNIYANGHKLYVNGTEVSINQSEAPESFLSNSTETVTIEEVQTTNANSSINIPLLASCIAGGIIIIAGFIALIIKNKKSETSRNQDHNSSNQTPPTLPTSSPTPPTLPPTPPTPSATDSKAQPSQTQSQNS